MIWRTEDHYYMRSCIKLALGEKKDSIVEKSYLIMSTYLPALYLQGRHGIVQMAHPPHSPEAFLNLVGDYASQF